MSTHGSIVNLLVSLGYTKTEGCCHGVSLRWLEACFLDEEALFDARIKKIVSGGEALVHLIHAVKEKKGHNLTADDNELLGILAFYDSLELYQFPELHSLLFNKPLSQCDVGDVSDFAFSDAIKFHGGLVEIYSEPCIYTQKEMKSYFDGLGGVLEKVCTQSKDPLGIVLSSSNHTIALTYSSGKGWIFMDINQYPSKRFMVNETDLLVECIMMSFIESNSFYSAFNVSIFTTGNHLGVLNLEGTFAPFKKSHLLTKEIASREAEGIGLARIAAQYNHAPVIAELAKYDVDLNNVDIEGTTPAFIAAEKGHALVIAELAKHQVDLNKDISNGLTPAFIAAQEGHVSVIAELIKVGVNFNTPYTSSVVNLRQFAISRDDKIIERMNDFIDQQLALSPASHTISMTPYHIAVVMGHRKIMQLLNKQEEYAQSERLNASHQLMEHTQSGIDKRTRDGHTFFSSSSVKQDEESNGVNQQEYSDVYQGSGERQLGEMDGDVVQENDKKGMCYFL